MGNHVYDDAWILAKWKDILNWNRLCVLYNEAHGCSVGYSAFKSHCNRDLGLNFQYTDEQKAWLKENYPNLGRVKAAEAFNRIFHENKTPGAIRIAAEKLGLRVSAQRKKNISIENTGRCHPVGTIVPKAHGEPYMKTENGWIPVKNLLMGLHPGQVLAHLDGNTNNCNPENLVVISRAVFVKMAKNGFWSDNPVITKTGILWCELDEALRKTGAVKPGYFKIPEVRMPKERKQRTLDLAPTSNTGELHIHKDRNGYFRVIINKSFLKYNNTFKTLERAIQVRDMLLDGAKKLGKSNGAGQ